MKDSEKLKPFEMGVAQHKHRNRIGCDICKALPRNPTQCFIGYCGDILWICGKCFKKITKSKQ